MYPTVKLEFEWNKPNIFPMALTYLYQQPFNLDVPDFSLTILSIFKKVV